MRFTILLPLLAACADSYGSLSIDPPDGPPLGVGLVQRFTVTQDLCDGGVDGTCDPTYPPHLAARVGSGSAVAIAGVDEATASVDVAGLAEGSATIVVSGADGASLSRTIDVIAVAQTTLTVPRDTGYAVHSPVRAFTNAQVTIAQENLGAGGTAVAGEAPLQSSSGLVAVNGDTVTASATTGTAQITAALATLELDIVDASALADFTIDGSAVDELVLYTSTGTATASLLASDAAGQPIVGGGPAPTFSIADPSIVAVTGGSGDGNTRELDLEPLASGNTTLQLTWGQVTKTFAISVVAR